MVSKSNAVKYMSLIVMGMFLGASATFFSQAGFTAVQWDDVAWATWVQTAVILAGLVLAWAGIARQVEAAMIAKRKTVVDLIEAISQRVVTARLALEEGEPQDAVHRLYGHFEPGHFKRLAYAIGELPMHEAGSSDRVMSLFHLQHILGVLESRLDAVRAGPHFYEDWSTLYGKTLRTSGDQEAWSMFQSASRSIIRAALETIEATDKYFDLFANDRRKK